MEECSNPHEMEDFIQEAPPNIKLREMRAKLRTTVNADGSALYGQGKTCVLATVRGPVEPQGGDTDVKKAFVDCVYMPKSNMPTIRDTLRESIIRESCESAIKTACYPRALISVHVQELDDQSGLEACAINGACLAMLVGSLEMRYTIAAVHCILDKNQKLVVDPDYVQALGAFASFTFVFESLNRDLVTVNTRGVFEVEQFDRAEELCRAASESVFRFYRQSLMQLHQPFMKRKEAKKLN